jgi:hypothetical protein
MILDVVDLIAPSAAFRASSFKMGSTPSICYLSDPDPDGLRDLVEMKGLNGFPWDWMTVGQDYIYQRLTESVWSDPSSGKIYLGKGVPRFPRFIDYSPDQQAQVIHRFTVKPPQTNYVLIAPGGIATGGSSNNDCRCTFFGPNQGQPIGDLPAGVDWILEYERGGKNGVYVAMERLTHRQGFGRYKWEQFNWRADGSYTTPVSQSSTTKIMSLLSPVIPVQKIF